MIEFRYLAQKRIDPKIFKKLYRKIFPARGSTRGFELSVVIAPPSLMRRLNKQYRGKDKTANTLSFLLEKNKGEIFLNLKEKNLPYLFVHSALHLLGFEHRRKKGAELMEQKEIKILKSKS